MEDGLKISELAQASSISNADLIPIVQNNETKSVSLVDMIYPIGSIYMSVNNVNPSTLFGGTWEQIKDKFLLSAGDTYTLGSTGGSATHNLTLSQLPSGTTLTAKIGANAWSLGIWSNKGQTTSEWSAQIQGQNGTPTGGEAFSKMPPFLAVNIWKRTA